MEAKARKQGEEPPPRGGSRGQSTCDCQNTDGLNVKPLATICPPVAPPSLFEYLEDCDAERVDIKGREARRVPHLPGPTFVTAMGRLCCRHGASRVSLTKARKTCTPSNRMPTCDCDLKPMPVRSNGIRKLRLGKWDAACVVLAERDGA